MNLAPYKFSDDELLILKSEYKLILNDVDLSSISKETIDNITNDCGVYFWLMNFKGKKYKK